MCIHLFVSYSDVQEDVTPDPELGVRPERPCSRLDAAAGGCRRATLGAARHRQEPHPRRVPLPRDASTHPA